MGEGQGVAGLQVGSDVLLIDLGLQLVGNEDHDDVAFLGGLVHGGDLQTSLFGLSPALGTLAQADAHVNAGIHEVEGMGMALRTIANDSDLLPLEDLRIDVVFVVDRNSHGGNSFLLG